jgi:hypothetical protein
MRRSVSILVAAAMVAASAAAGVAPAEAFVRAAPVAVATSTGIVKADNWRYNRGYRRHYDRRSYAYPRRYRVTPFYFPFPFAFTPRYYSYRYQDCFRTWDGRVYCRRY